MTFHAARQTVFFHRPPAPALQLLISLYPRRMKVRSSLGLAALLFFLGVTRVSAGWFGTAFIFPTPEERLAQAVVDGKPEGVKLLLDKGASVDGVAKARQLAPLSLPLGETRPGSAVSLPPVLSRLVRASM